MCYNLCHKVEQSEYILFSKEKGAKQYEILHKYFIEEGRERNG